MLFRRRSDAPRPVSRLGADTAPEIIPINGLDHVELYVGNPLHAARLLTALGFDVVASQGRHSGVQDLVSYVLRQGEATLLITGGTTPRQDAVVHVAARGDSVKDVAWSVPDADQAYGSCIRRDITPEHLPVNYNDDHGDLALCPVASPAGVLHTLVQRHGYAGKFCPGFVDDHDVAVPPRESADDVPIATAFDGLTFVVRPQTLAAVTEYYTGLFGFEVTEQHQLESGNAPDLAAARVLRRAGVDASVVLVEPGRRRERTHLDEFLRLHDGPGVQTISLRTDDVVAAVERLRSRGLPVLTPDTEGEPTELGVPGIVAEQIDDGQVLRSATVGPLQHRVPLMIELVERRDTGAFPVAARRAHHRQLAARARGEATRAVLNTWQAGR